MEKSEHEIKILINILEQIKVGFLPQETQIHSIIAESLVKNGIEFQHEYRLSSDSRIDFLSGNIGVEVKKSTVKDKELLKQLKKYSESDKISKIILVTTKSVNIPSFINNKQIYIVNLYRNWSISL
ncbi:MAG: hypothetical protein SPI49_06785 [Eubacteriales bacterium]|nr:hypothetical protein [Eubacteriales bacterium]